VDTYDMYGTGIDDIGVWVSIRLCLLLYIVHGPKKRKHT
jgi:hypothetical protein